MTKENLLVFKKTLNILYIEDDITVRDVMSDILNDMFNNVIFAKNGEDGIKKFINYNKEKIDLILSDIAMPKMDGIVMAKKIRKIDIDIPIIF